MIGKFVVLVLCVATLVRNTNAPEGKNSLLMLSKDYEHVTHKY